MKTAEEVAEKMLLACECSERTWSDDYREGLKNQFIGVLTAFAEERVKYAWGKDDLDHFERVCNVARAQALEEAAKIADGRKFYDPEGFLASAIRALIKP